MKKLIVPLLVVSFVTALASCGLNPVSNGDDDTSRQGGGDDGGDRRELPRTVTLRLADYGEYENDTIGIGLGNTVAARALTLDNAQASHDFFEAVFYHPNSGTVARTVWDIGETPELRGVHRTDDGINYGNVTNNPTAGQGSAILFVGAKADKTLLALGKLIEVDGVEETTITTNTKSVTFEVDALKAGTSYTAANSSFQTNFRTSPNGTVNATNTVIYNDIFIHYNGKKTFPFYLMNRDDAVHGTPGPGAPLPDAGNALTKGQYTFDTGTNSFNQYTAGIALAGGYNFEVRNPRYIITDGLYQYSSILVQDLRNGLVDMIDNKQPVGYIDNSFSNTVYFTNPIKFEITTTNSPNGSIFALVFEIFVYNLTPRPSTALEGGVPAPYPDPVKWRISPGMGTKWLDLDDGLGTENGAILLGSGDVRAWLAPYTP